MYVIPAASMTSTLLIGAGISSSPLSKDWQDFKSTQNSAVFEPVNRCLQNWPELRDLLATPSDRIGLAE
jgi:hypothetical protein